ncbi:MAG: NAD(P)/FAD-dependent oxidoreductase [Lachnospiraceae bacterium]
MSNVIVIGAGAAGMMAAIAAAGNGHQVTVLEKNEKAGKKIYITGKGRCNITNACDVEELFNNVVTNKKFLYSAFYGFTNDDVVAMLNTAGLATKVERGNRVFPVSDRAGDVIAALVRIMKKLGVKLEYDTTVTEIITGTLDKTDDTAAAADGGKCGAAAGAIATTVTGVRCASGKVYPADAVIVATGGVSYPTTGSTGDGYEFAQRTGHNVTALSPALVPFNVAEEDVKELQGLALKNSGVTIYDGKKKLYEDFGELLFTHFGVSGPTVLSASSYVAKKIKDHPLRLVIDLKPGLDTEQLDARVLRDFDEFMNKNFNNALDKLLPKSLIPVVIRRSGIDEYKKVHEISREERMRLIGTIKNLEFTLTGLRGFNEAIITQGGVSVRDVDPSTMESKKVSGLYFAGEVLDLDAVTGGFNLQIAWSTGHLAGMSV